MDTNSYGMNHHTDPRLISTANVEMSVYAFMESARKMHLTTGNGVTKNQFIAYICAINTRIMPQLKHLILILLPAFTVLYSIAQQDPRFLITEKDKVGYMDVHGKTIIEPVYLNGADFSEGLAAVRVGGKYGFIDADGKWVIPASYDFASSFRFGLAAVYTNGKVQLVDRSGKCVLENPDYKNLYLISANRAVVSTVENRYELIDIRLKKSLVKTPLLRINQFQDGVAVVSRKGESKEKYPNPDYAVIDTNGRIIVGFGTYSEIHDFVDGYALVEGFTHKKRENEFDGVIDTKGKLIFRRPKTSQSYLFRDFHNGLTVISFNNYWNAEKKEFSAVKKDYQGYMDLTGEIVLNDTLNRYLYDFAGGRTFLKDAKGTFQLYDKRLNRVSEEVFDQYENPGFSNGLARVRKKYNWGLIDTNGRYLFEPKFAGIFRIDYEHQLLIYESDTESGQPLYGIANFKGEPVGDSNIQRVDPGLFKNGLLRAIVNDRLSYINTSGKVVWQEQLHDSQELVSLDTEYMISGYFTAISEDDDDDMGGFGRGVNSAKPITDNKQFKPGELSILVDSSKPDTFAKQYKGFKVYLANKLSDTVRFNAQDSRLYMNVQAKDVHGNWKDIEHLPSSWCGNSYHTLRLEPDHYWDFVTPVYSGEFKTKLRIKLEVRSSGKSKDKSYTIYSNEYDASVNPGQFWNKDHHIPTGIMDPYSY